MTERTDLLVIGAGPYAYAAAAWAGANGIDTRTCGTPMSFWRERMPTDMFLRSGPDWHLDPAGVHTFEAYFEDAGLDPADHDPVPIGVFLDHTDWFRERTGLEVDERHVASLATHADGGFVATLDDGTELRAEKVLAAPGVGHFVNLPDWHDRVPAGRGTHTLDLVDFDALSGARVAVIGGRQSAYEWAALLCDHGAASVDVVHRHPTPDFARVSWAFADPYVEQSLAHRGWWRDLPLAEQQAIALEFWQVGRLTLEHWLVPRLRPEVVTSHPETHVVAVADHPRRRHRPHAVRRHRPHRRRRRPRLRLPRRRHRRPLPRPRSSTASTAPTASPASVPGWRPRCPGLFMTGFVATRDFGPFYGFTKGCPSAAAIAVAEMLR